MRGEPLNALKTATINTIQYINDNNYIGILDELLAILADSDDRARAHRNALSHKWRLQHKVKRDICRPDGSIK